MTGHQHQTGGEQPPGVPGWLRFCARCAAPLETREVGDRLRRACPACGYVHYPDPKVGVGAIVVVEDRLLLVRRRMHPEKGRWAVPGGYLDSGEDPAVTAAREVAEETGLEVAIAGLVGAFHNPEPGGATVFLLYDGRLLGGTLAAGDDASEAAFFAATELPELAFVSTREAVRAWLAGSG